MKNINKITKKFYNDTISNAEDRYNEMLLDFRSRYNEDTANMFYISEYCEDESDVVDWICSNKIVDDEDKQDRLAELICKKVKRDTSNWLDKLNQVLFERIANA